MSADPVTRRAEEIRESTGCAWEIACRRAERERDDRERPRLAHIAGLIPADHAQLWPLDSLRAAAARVVAEGKRLPVHGPYYPANAADAILFSFYLAR